MTPALTVERSSTRPSPQERQQQLVAVVRRRDQPQTLRLVEAWVHRYGLGSLETFRRDTLPQLLDEADLRWLEACMGEPLPLQAIPPAAPSPSGEGAPSLCPAEALQQQPPIPAAALPMSSPTPLADPAPVEPERPVPIGAAVPLLIGSAEPLGSDPGQQPGASGPPEQPAGEPGVSAAVCAPSSLDAGGQALPLAASLPVEQPLTGASAAGASGSNGPCLVPVVPLEAAERRSDAITGTGSALALAFRSLGQADPDGRLELAGLPDGAPAEAGGEPQAAAEPEAVPEPQAEPELAATFAAIEPIGLVIDPISHGAAPEPLASMESDLNPPTDSAGPEHRLQDAALAQAVSAPAQAGAPDDWLSPSDEPGAAAAEPLPQAWTAAPDLAGGALVAADTRSAEVPTAPTLVLDGQQAAGFCDGSEPGGMAAPELEAAAAAEVEIQGDGETAADGPEGSSGQRRGRFGFAGFARVRALMRDCFEEAISTLQARGEVEAEDDPDEDLSPVSGRSATAADWRQPPSAGPASDLAAARFGSRRLSEPLPAARANGSAAPAAPEAGAATDSAPAAAWNRPLGQIVPPSSLGVPLQGPPAPAPAALADLRAWLPGRSGQGQGRRAS